MRVARRAEGRYPRKWTPVANPVLNGLLPADGPANRTRGSDAERQRDSSQVKL